MRKILFFAVVVIFASACNSPKHKAEKLVKDLLNYKYFSKNDGYKSEGFETLDSSFVSCYGRIPEYDSVKDLMFKEYDDTKKERLCEVMDSIEVANKGDFIGWEILHDYSVLNEYNKREDKIGLYFFDKDMTKVFESEKELRDYNVSIPPKK